MRAGRESSPDRHDGVGGPRHPAPRQLRADDKAAAAGRVERAAVRQHEHALDPRRLAVREVVTQADTPEFGAGTALVEVGDKLWVGSFRGNRIVIVPAP